MGAALRLPWAVFSGRLTTNFMCRSSIHDHRLFTIQYHPNFIKNEACWHHIIVFICLAFFERKISWRYSLNSQVQHYFVVTGAPPGDQFMTLQKVALQVSLATEPQFEPEAEWVSCIVFFIAKSTCFFRQLWSGSFWEVVFAFVTREQAEMMRKVFRKTLLQL